MTEQTKTNNPIQTREQMLEEYARQLQEFLQTGGTIEQCAPRGFPSKYNPSN